MGTRFRRAGYATEGTAAAIGWLRERGLHSFVAHIHPDHEASNAVAARLGFVSTNAVRGGETRWELDLRCHN